MKTAFVVVAEEQPTRYAEVWPGIGQLTRQPGSVSAVILRHYPGSQEAADEIHSQIPKSYKVQNRWGQLEHRTNLRGNEANGGINEAGLARYRKLRKKLEDMGHKVVFGPKDALPQNDYPTEEQFEQALKDREAHGDPLRWSGLAR